MKPAVTRFLLTVVLFAGWLGFLGYEVLTRPVLPDKEPLVVSRPQILTSDLDVVATLGKPGEGTSPEGGNKIKVNEVLGGEGAEAGEEVVVYGLLDSQPPAARGAASRPDWSGPGDYLIPLKKRPRGPKGSFDVAGIPPSPTCPPHLRDVKRIYPATPETRAQYRQCEKPAAE